MTFLRTILVLIFTSTYVVAQHIAGQFGSLAEDSNQPIEAQADKMEIDEATGQIQMSGTVEIVQGLTKLTAAFVRIEYTEDQNNIKTIYASGSVYLESSGDVAKGDEATYQLSENMIYLNGNAMLVQENNTLNAENIKLNTETGSAVMTGRVSTTLIPGGN
jgi:lipopolysaccharide export system protein LptA